MPLTPEQVTELELSRSRYGCGNDACLPATQSSTPVTCARKPSLTQSLTENTILVLNVTGITTETTMAEKQLWLQWQEDMRAEGAKQERDRIVKVLRETDCLTNVACCEDIGRNSRGCLIDAITDTK